MVRDLKKPYVKPVVKKIRLDAKTAVLAACKSTGKFGPAGSGCAAFGGGGSCSAAGS